MKKIIFLVSSLIIIGIFMGFLLFCEKEEKIKEKGEVIVSNQVKRQKSLYVSVVPKVDQEYTLNIEEETVNKSDEIIDTINEEVVIENMINIIDNNVDEVVIEKEVTEVISNETEEMSVINNENTDDMKLENEKQESIDFYFETNVDDLKKENKTETNIKYGFYEEEGNTYYYENDVKVTGIKNIDGINHYFSPSGKYLGTTKIKVIDVSYYQGDINWDLFASDSDCYGVILRLGYYDTLDKTFERNISELKRLNIPYGIYLFSYSTTLTGALKEANFTNNMIDKYDINPVLGIYYDIESWQAKNGASSNSISKEMYDDIIQAYINCVSNHVNYKYKVKVYSGRWYAMNRLGEISKKYVDWVAEYNSICKYDGIYSMWQYTSKGNASGITGNVDISYLY